MRTQRTLAILALGLSAGAAGAQEETVPVSVEGTTVEVPSDIAAAACGLDDDQLEAALRGTGEIGTATEVETAATTTGTTEDTSTGTTDDVAAAGETGAGAIAVGDADDAPEGTDPDMMPGDEDAGEADEGGSDDVADAADASAGVTPLCEISQAEATAQGIELP